jgi:hypothetical protein
MIGHVTPACAALHPGYEVRYSRQGVARTKRERTPGRALSALVSLPGIAPRRTRGAPLSNHTGLFALPSGPYRNVGQAGLRLCVGVPIQPVSDTSNSMLSGPWYRTSTLPWPAVPLRPSPMASFTSARG